MLPATSIARHSRANSSIRVRHFRLCPFAQYRTRNRRPRRRWVQLPATVAGEKQQHVGAAGAGEAAVPPGATADARAEHACGGLRVAGRCGYAGSRNADTVPPAASSLPQSVRRAQRDAVYREASNERCRSARRHVAQNGPVFGQGPPARAGSASSPLSAIDLLQSVDRQLALGEHALELGILGFEFA